MMTFTLSFWERFDGSQATFSVSLTAQGLNSWVSMTSPW